MRRFLKNILPQSLIDFYKNQKKISKEKKRIQLKNNNCIVTQQLISNELQKVGLTKGDTILVHSSLSKIGFVDGGANTVINALNNCIGNEGTILMPAFPAIGFNYDYLKTNPVFDINNTPSKMGIITELFRKMHNVYRSLHPTDSVCAFGKNAEYLVKEHFNQLTPYNEFSPFYKLVKLKGKIVLLGVDLNSLTNFHTFEDAIADFKFPVYHHHQFNCNLIDENGQAKTMQTKVHNPTFSKKRQCNAFIKPFLNDGVMQAFTIGLAQCYILDAEKLHNWMLDNYIKKGVTLYTPNGN